MTREQKDRKNALRRERYANDPEYKERIAAHNRKWATANKDKASACHRDWYASLPEEEKQKQRGRKQRWLLSQSPEKRDLLRQRWVAAKLQKRREQLEKAIALLGGHCVICGLVDHSCVYDFHHVREKTYTLGKMFSNKPWDLIEKELAKCVLLCAPCHRKLHMGLVSLGVMTNG